MAGLATAHAVRTSMLNGCTRAHTHTRCSSLAEFGLWSDCSRAHEWVLTGLWVLSEQQQEPGARGARTTEESSCSSRSLQTSASLSCGKVGVNDCLLAFIESWKSAMCVCVCA